MKHFSMSRQQAEEHQRKHGFVKGGDAPLIPKIKNKGAATVRSAAAPMNKTEIEFALILETKKRYGEIVRYEFEGITLRWGGIRYTPDFVVFAGMAEMCRAAGLEPTREVTEAAEGCGWRTMTLIEVKGGHIWDDALVKFKAARAHWPEFMFEMHQKKNGVWRKIYGNDD